MRYLKWALIFGLEFAVLALLFLAGYIAASLFSPAYAGGMATPIIETRPVPRPLICRVPVLGVSGNVLYYNILPEDRCRVAFGDDIETTSRTPDEPDDGGDDCEPDDDDDGKPKPDKPKNGNNGHGNNGHGNDADGNDSSNPGNSNNGDGTDDDGKPGKGKK